MSSRVGPRSPSSVTPWPSRSSGGAAAVSAPSPPPRGGCASLVRGCRAEAPGVHGPPAGAPSAARRVKGILIFAEMFRRLQRAAGQRRTRAGSPALDVEALGFGS
eukprot:4784516-Pleurochrysis_carterae.AAC.1